MSRIERWTRHLLEAEARKRSIRNPELRSRTELLRAIVQHDYGARQSLRGARKLVGSLLDGAAQALPLFGSRRDKSLSQGTSGARQAGRHGPATPYEPTAPRGPDATNTLTPGAEGAPPQPSAAAASSIELRREPGQLQLRWQVSGQDIDRARRLLGQHGELSLRIVCVQADPTQIVRSEVTEHGPLDPQGVWTLSLAAPETSCVGSVGLRHGDRFVSIAHQSSRANADANANTNTKPATLQPNA